MSTGYRPSLIPVNQQQQIERVLIMTVSAGEGHTRAAAAVKGQIAKHYPAAQVPVLDTFRYASPRLEKMVLGTYLELLKVSPLLYKYLYNTSERGNPLGGVAKNEFVKIMTSITGNKLLNYIDSVNPQIILCTHPFSLGIAATMKKKGLINVPVVAILTDFTVHSYWVYSGVDYYCVATEALKSSLVEYSQSPEQIIVTGIPIDTAFVQIQDTERIKNELNLDLSLPTILVMGGGLGLGPLKDVVDVLSARKDCQIVVVCGHNDGLKRQIEQTTQFIPHIHTFGFVDNIHQLMGVADLMITKAGGLSCSEALALGLPLFIIDPIPGQEEKNTQFLVEQGAAVEIKDNEHLQKQIEQWFRNPQQRAKMASASQNIGQPDAAEKVLGLIKHIICC